MAPNVGRALVALATLVEALEHDVDFHGADATDELVEARTALDALRSPETVEGSK